MNIEIANRLVKLRKDKNLSQEALANALGISRQAVSKWERAESSPDTDNLILLSKLYDISLDELLNTDQERFESNSALESEEREENTKEAKNYVHVSLKHGVHIREPDGEEVHIGWDGIHIKESDGEEIHVNWRGTLKDINWLPRWRTEKQCESCENQGDNNKKFPLTIIITVAYIILGVKYQLWHPGWIVFLIIPIVQSTMTAIKQRNIMRFCYPALVFLYIGYQGFVKQEWYLHWLWILSIPVFYSVAGYVHHKVLDSKK